MGMLVWDPVGFVDPLGLLCFDGAKFGNQVRKNRADNMLTLGSLLTAEAIGTMPKTRSELRGFGPK